jgi:hypothetical protein
MLSARNSIWSGSSPELRLIILSMSDEAPRIVWREEAPCHNERPQEYKVRRICLFFELRKVRFFIIIFFFFSTSNHCDLQSSDKLSFVYLGVQVAKSNMLEGMTWLDRRRGSNH